MRVANLTEIHPQLYISDLEYAWENHAKYDLVVSLGASRELPPMAQLPSARHPLEDAFSAPLEVDLGDSLILESAAKQAQKQLVHGKVLIHCGAGENRAPAVAVVLARRLGMPADKAVAAVIAAKKEIDPSWDTFSNTRLRELAMGKVNRH